MTYDMMMVVMMMVVVVIMISLDFIFYSSKGKYRKIGAHQI